MRYRSLQTTPAFTLRREIDRLFDDTFGARTQRAWLPEADVRESADAYEFELELPGVAPEQVELTADNGVLTVRGEKRARERREGEDARAHIVERSFGTFLRAFQLPQGVEDGGISAEFEHGVLTVRVPKAQRPKPRRIEVRPSSGAQRLGEGEVAAPGTDAARGPGGDAGEGATRGSPRGSAERGRRETTGAR